MADSKELYALREVFKRIAENHTEYSKQFKELNDKLEQIITDLASLTALIVTITSSEAFQKIIAKELEKIADEAKEGDNNGEGTT